MPGRPSATVLRQRTKGAGFIRATQSLLAALVTALALATQAGAVTQTGLGHPSIDSMTPAQLRAYVYRVDPCLATIIDAEDPAWSPTAGYHGSHSTAGSYGLPQADPGTKMASAGPNWRTSATTQLAWARAYVNARYGGSCAALVFRRGHGYY